MDALPTLTGSRLTLRQLAASDAPDLLELFGDFEVVRMMGIRQLADTAAAERFVESVHSSTRGDTLYQWGAVLGTTGRLVGTVTLASLDARNQRAEIGFAVARAHWRQGYAREALGLGLNYAFGELGLHRVEADVDPENLASLRLLHRLGFRREGFLPERWLIAGEWRDSLLLGLMARDWQGPARSS